MGTYKQVNSVLATLWVNRQSWLSKQKIPVNLLGYTTELGACSDFFTDAQICCVYLGVFQAHTGVSGAEEASRMHGSLPLRNSLCAEGWIISPPTHVYAETQNVTDLKESFQN